MSVPHRNISKSKALPLFQTFLIIYRPVTFIYFSRGKFICFLPTIASFNKYFRSIETRLQNCFRNRKLTKSTYKLNYWKLWLRPRTECNSISPYIKAHIYDFLNFLLGSKLSAFSTRLCNFWEHRPFGEKNKTLISFVYFSEWKNTPE